MPPPEKFFFFFQTTITIKKKLLTNAHLKIICMVGRGEVENRGSKGGEVKGGREKSKLLTKQALKKVDGSLPRMTGSPLGTRHRTSVTSEAW